LQWGITRSTEREPGCRAPLARGSCSIGSSRRRWRPSGHGVRLPWASLTRVHSEKSFGRIKPLGRTLCRILNTFVLKITDFEVKNSIPGNGCSIFSCSAPHTETASSALRARTISSAFASVVERLSNLAASTRRARSCLISSSRLARYALRSGDVMVTAKSGLGLRNGGCQNHRGGRRKGKPRAPGLICSQNQTWTFTDVLYRGPLAWVGDPLVTGSNDADG